MTSDSEDEPFVPTATEAFLALLWDDVSACGITAESATSQPQRRQFMRSMFACVEGAVWLFKQETLEQQQAGFIALSPSELSVLSEIAPFLDAQGSIQEQPSNLRFGPNLVFAFRMHARAFNYELALKASDHEWNDLKSSAGVRNRLMHPKSLQSMTVTDDELARARGALKWFGLTCSVATVGVSMWYAARSLKDIVDRDDANARLQTISEAADNLRQIIIRS